MVPALPGPPTEPFSLRFNRLCSNMFGTRADYMMLVGRGQGDVRRKGCGARAACCPAMTTPRCAPGPPCRPSS